MNGIAGTQTHDSWYVYKIIEQKFNIMSDLYLQFQGSDAVERQNERFSGIYSLRDFDYA